MKSVIAVLSAVLVAGCQTYDFEHVNTLAIVPENHSQLVKARSLKPNVMLLVDTSASMGALTDPNSRISQLKVAMNTFFTRTGTPVARFGLAVFPESNGPTRAVKVALPPATPNDVGTGTDAAVKANADAVNNAIQALPAPAGSTPTSASLAFLGEEPDLNADDWRRDFILLLTDGLPNGNEANPNGLCDCLAGGCSQARIDACMCAADSCESAGLCSTGCLDADGTVATIAALQGQKNIDTIVIGFGDDLTTGTAPQVLDRMARAGHQPRSCANDANACGADACGADKICATSFYQATDAASLAQAIEDSLGNIKGICQQSLSEKPSDPRFLSVIVDGVTLDPGADTYTYDGDVGITFNGATCDKLETSTPQNPVRLDIRTASKL